MSEQNEKILKIKSRCEAIIASEKELAEENMDNIIFMMNPKKMELCQVVVAWKNVNAHMDYRKEEQSISDDWQYIWQFCEFDPFVLANISGVNYTDVLKLFEQVKMLKLIYPDGTVNPVASQLIKGMIKSNLRKLSTPQKKS